MRSGTESMSGLRKEMMDTMEKNVGIYRSEDGGGAWTNVTPPGLGPSARAGMRYSTPMTATPPSVQ